MSDLGLRATNDPALIGRIKAGAKGADPRSSTVDAIYKAMRDYDALAFRARIGEKPDKATKKRVRRFQESRAA